MIKKTLLLIGGTRGIGKAVSDLLSQEWNVVSVSRSPNAQGQRFDAVTNTWEGPFPEQVDAVIYAPGTINLKPFHRISVEELQLELQINFLAPFHLLQRCYPLLKKGQNPSVVLFSTVAVAQGMPFHAGIASAKGAVEGLVRSLAAEWSPTIRVNAIAPSLTNTTLAEKLLNTEAKQTGAAERHPLKRIGQPEDIARMATFLVSDGAGWITGQVLHVDGGMSTIRPV
jgi:3-oxoacyl-[acyl-carrier protein] reductase